jgi:hypothetical protein
VESRGAIRWLNDGSGVFAASGLVLGASWSRDVALADLDNDNDLDAFLANNGANRVWLNGGRGAGTTCQCVVEWLSANTSGQAVGNPVISGAERLAQLVLGVNLFYRVRDQVLGQTAKERRYADLYYTQDREVLTLLVADPALRDAGAATLSLWEPNLQALVDGHGDDATITMEQVAVTDSFLDALAAAGSPGLQQMVVEERAALGPLTGYVGMTMEQARGGWLDMPSSCRWLGAEKRRSRLRCPGQRSHRVLFEDHVT